MAEFLAKFELLDAAERQQLLAYMDKLLVQRKPAKPRFDLEAYRKNLLKVSIWSEEDLAIFEDIRQHINAWRPASW